MSKIGIPTKRLRGLLNAHSPSWGLGVGGIKRKGGLLTAVRTWRVDPRRQRRRVFCHLFVHHPPQERHHATPPPPPLPRLNLVPSYSFFSGAPSCAVLHTPRHGRARTSACPNSVLFQCTQVGVRFGPSRQYIYPANQGFRDEREG